MGCCHGETVYLPFRESRATLPGIPGEVAARRVCKHCGAAQYLDRFGVKTPWGKPIATSAPYVSGRSWVLTSDLRGGISVLSLPDAKPLSAGNRPGQGDLVILNIPAALRHHFDAFRAEHLAPSGLVLCPEGGSYILTPHPNPSEWGRVMLPPCHLTRWI